MAFSADGKTLVSGSGDHTIKRWNRKNVARNLWLYLDEGSCEFDVESEALVWKEPTRHLYHTSSRAFRNVSRNSSVGILQQDDLDEGSRNWLLYLGALQAENWATASLYFERLSDTQRSDPNRVVMHSTRKLATRVAEAAHGKDRSPDLALIRLHAVQKITGDWPPSQRMRVFGFLGRAMGFSTLSKEEGREILGALPDDETREFVLGEIPVGMADRVLDELQDGDALDYIAILDDRARDWGHDLAAIFREAGVSLEEQAKLLNEAVFSDHQLDASVALLVSELLLQREWSSEGVLIDGETFYRFYVPYYRGLALAKAGRYGEAIEFYEEAAKMASKSEDEEFQKAKESFLERIEDLIKEAREKASQPKPQPGEGDDGKREENDTPPETEDSTPAAKPEDTPSQPDAAPVPEQAANPEAQ